MNKPTVIVKTFAKFELPYKAKRIIPVKTRNVEELNLPEECDFYFFDSYVGIVNGVEYRFGPEFNESAHYYKCRDYYPDVEKFRVYFMRLNGWSEDKIQNMEKLDFNPFENFNSTEYPNGVIIVDSTITNPGKTGVILSAKNVFEDYRIPLKEEVERYLACADD